MDNAAMKIAALALALLAGCAAGPRQPVYWEPPPAQPLIVPTNNAQLGGAQQQTNYGAAAFWTGSGQQVQTVTGQTAVRCEYRYGGNVFYRLFPLGCPQSVQVQ